MGQEKLFPQFEELEEEANNELGCMSLDDLIKMSGQIKHSLATNQAFAKDYQYWKALLTKTNQEIAKVTIQQIYGQCLCDRRAELNELRFEPTPAISVDPSRSSTIQA